MKTNDVEIHNAKELFQMDDQRDLAYCGCSLSTSPESSFASVGAHAPTYTCYFALDTLFHYFNFTAQSKLLDVGCDTGRVLAYYAQMKYPGRAVGIEIDPSIAERCRDWSKSHDNLNVITGNVLEIDLESYTDFYLFNPFDDAVLEKFIHRLETQAKQQITLVCLSDDPSISYINNHTGWSILKSGYIQEYQGIDIYRTPQHYSILRYTP